MAVELWYSRRRSGRQYVLPVEHARDGERGNVSGHAVCRWFGRAWRSRTGMP